VRDGEKTVQICEEHSFCCQLVNIRRLAIGFMIGRDTAVSLVFCENNQEVRFLYRVGEEGKKESCEKRFHAP